MTVFLDILKNVVDINNFGMEDMYMKKLVKVVLSLTAVVAVLGGVWMVLSKVFGEEEYEDDYDDYYMEDEVENEKLPRGNKRRGYFTIDLNKNAEV